MVTISGEKSCSSTLPTYNAPLSQRNQRVLIQEFLIREKVDILLVQESGLKPSTIDPRIVNCVLTRQNRLTSRGGGSLIYYKRLLHCSTLNVPPLQNLETCAVRIAMTGRASLVIVSAYLSCQKSLLETDLEVLFGLGPAVRITRDRNSKHQSWSYPTPNTNWRESASPTRYTLGIAHR